MLQGQLFLKQKGPLNLWDTAIEAEEDKVHVGKIIVNGNGNIGEQLKKILARQ